MEIRIDPKTGRPQIKLNESDIEIDKKVRDMLKSEGWRILHKYYEIAREQFIELGKNGVKTRAKRELSSERWAQLIGFDEFLMIPERIMERLKEYDEDLEKKEAEQKKEEQNGVPNDSGFDVV